ncbi:CHAT domain-containing tetratricopeptide repeat protein [Frankia gtarii]|uniref:CHAT domain-containing tetratricopeptide repeat protein n=1 Tax=Frankia gtarii TaxID=2950102 RepID=UPI0021C0CDEA|nr:CHAT domain-containing tetratricopeptide repeat protein [Frankia gtarii]
MRRRLLSRIRHQPGGDQRIGGRPSHEPAGPELAGPEPAGPEETRERRLARLRARLERFDTHGDPSAILDPQALEGIEELLSTTADLQTVYVAARLRYTRFIALSPTGGQEDLATAIVLFTALSEADPARFSQDFLASLEQTFVGSLDLWTAEAASRLTDAVASEDLPGLPEAIDLLTRTLAVMPDDHAGRVVCLSNLATALRVRYDRSGKPVDLDLAIDLNQQALALTPVDGPARAQILANLAVGLRLRFDRVGEQADLAGAIEAGRRAVLLTAADDAHRADVLGALTIVLAVAPDGRLWGPTGLDGAVEAGRRALTLMPTDDPLRPEILTVLGLALVTRYEWVGELADLDEAIDGHRQLAMLTADRSGAALHLTTLGLALQSRFGRVGELADQDEAIDLHRRALALAPAGGPRRTLMMANLGSALHTRFERLGDLADLDEAIDVGRQARAVASADDVAGAINLSNLGLALRLRFERVGERADVDEAVEVSREAVAATPVDHDSRAGWLSNLGIALRARFERVGALADLDEAIDVCRQALAATAVGRPGRVRYLANLGIALRTRFERLGEIADLEEAIDVSRQAVAAVPADHPGRLFVYLANLSALLRDRYERLGEPADLEEAIGIGRRAANGAPLDHPDRVGLLVNLSSALRVRYERARKPADLDEAIDAGRDGAEITVAPPRNRAIAAWSWGLAAAVGGRWEQAVAGFARAIDLLALVVQRGLTRSDQEGLLAEFGNLGPDAAACAIHAGWPDRAVELFEQGRGVLLGQALDTRTDLSAVAIHHPDLADRFTDLCRRLDHSDPPEASTRDPGSGPVEVAGGGPGVGAAGAGERQRRRRAADDLDETIDRIRALPGFEDFLRPPRLADLRSAAADGPVILVTVSQHGSYALILTADGLLPPVPLPGLTPAVVLDRVRDFLIVLAASRPEQDGNGLVGILGWLWDCLAAPVLDRIGVTDQPPRNPPGPRSEEAGCTGGGHSEQGSRAGWPRLWWCTSGLLSFLPIHAAGRHETRHDPIPATLLDRAVSSITPTVRALTHARRARADPSGSGSGSGFGLVRPPELAGGPEFGREPGRGARPGLILAVAMLHTPGASDLPGTEVEIRRLQSLFPGRVARLTGARATRDEVLAALPAYPWAHFACHGYADPENPSASRLLLTDHEENPLTVADIIGLRLAGARLAFLSACETGRPGVRLADEAIHLASAFQLAGYQHVIATLWPVGDTPAAALADAVYTALGISGHGPSGATGAFDPGRPLDVAGALHDAILGLRRLWPDAPAVWASHIHAGA